MVPHKYPCSENCVNCRFIQLQREQDAPDRPQIEEANPNSEGSEEMISPLSSYSRELIVHEPDESGPAELEKDPPKPEFKTVPIGGRSAFPPVTAIDWHNQSEQDDYWGMG